MKYRTQIINGKEYVYEDYSIWDKEKKCCKHKREYIGRIISGSFVPNKNYKLRQHNQDSDFVYIPADLSQDAHNNAASYILKYISKRAGLSQLMEQEFPDVLSLLHKLIYFLLVERIPLDEFPLWLKLNQKKSEAEQFKEDLPLAADTIQESSYMLNGDKAAEFMNKFYNHNMSGDLLVLFLSLNPFANSLEAPPEDALITSPEYVLVFERSSEKPIFFCQLSPKERAIDICLKIISSVKISDRENIIFFFQDSDYGQINELYRKNIKFISHVNPQRASIRIPLKSKMEAWEKDRRLDKISNGLWLEQLAWPYTERQGAHGEEVRKFVPLLLGVDYGPAKTHRVYLSNVSHLSACLSSAIRLKNSTGKRIYAFLSMITMTWETPSINNAFKESGLFLFFLQSLYDFYLHQIIESSEMLSQYSPVLLLRTLSNIKLNSKDNINKHFTTVTKWERALIDNVLSAIDQLPCL